MALIKYLEFGGTDVNTGEKRVTLIDNALIKTASNEIQEYWKDLVRKPDCFYLHVIAMSAGEYWGPNRRADWYGEENLKKYHELFVTQAKVYKHHINRPDSPSYGRVLYSYYNDNMHRVELILEVDKKNSQEYVDKIRKGEDIFVSMGMRVPRDECSICGNIASRLDDYCEHGKYMKNKVLADDRLVYRINHAPYNLFDISLVTRPADPVAWAMEKAASDTPCDSSDTVAVFDEDTFVTRNMLKTAVDKFADLIKEVELDTMEADTNDIDATDNSSNYSNISLDDNNVDDKIKLRVFIKRNKALPVPLNLPSLSYTDMEGLNINPAVPLLCALIGKVHLSLNELAYYIGKLYLKKMFNEHLQHHMVKNISIGVHNLQNNPSNILTSLIPVIEEFLKIDKDGGTTELDRNIHKLSKHIENTKSINTMLKHAGILPEKTTPFNTPELYEVRHNGNNKNVVELINKNDPVDMYLARKNDAHILTNGIDTSTDSKFVKMTGAITTLAGIASILTGKTEKALIGVPAVVIGGLLMAKGTLEEDKEDPRSFSFIEKKANAIDSKVEHITKLAALVPILGLGIPTALAADYMYTKYRAQKDPNYAQELGTNDYRLYNAGQFVNQHPFLATTATLAGLGTVAGMGKAIKNKFIRRKK